MATGQAGVLPRVLGGRGRRLEAAQAAEILQKGEADLIAIGREALYNPNWPLHAKEALGMLDDYADWPVQYGWWLDKRRKSLTPRG